MGIVETPEINEFNFLFKNGKSQCDSYFKLTCKQINGEIQKVILFYSLLDGCLTGMRMLDDSDLLIYESSYKEGLGCNG